MVSEHELLNARATPDLLRIISDSEFLVLDRDNRIDEKIPFSEFPKNFGTPVIGDNVFVRIGGTGNAEQVLEFRPTKNPTSSWEIRTDDLAEPNEIINFDDQLGGEIGAFNFDGTSFLLPVTRITTVNSTTTTRDRLFILFNVKLDASTFNITDISVETRIEIPSISFDPGSVSSIRSEAGNFLVASINGAFRIDRNARVQQISPAWTLDFFRFGSDIYATSFSANQLFVSDDNGTTWEQSTISSELGLVKVTGLELVTQFQGGSIFETPIDDNNPFEVAEMRLNPELENQIGLYNIFEFFNGNYYLSVGKELYFAPEIVVVE